MQSDVKNISELPEAAQNAHAKRVREWQFKLPRAECLLLAAVVAGTVLFSLAAHGFAYFNYMPQHDAVFRVSGVADLWEVQSGRFMLPVLAALHFGVATPWLTGLFCMVNMSAASYFICKVCGISKLWVAFLAAGALSANLCFVELTAVFPYLSDPYALSIALASAAVYLASEVHGNGRFAAHRAAALVAAVLLMMVSFGIYQASGAFVIVLFFVSACRVLLSHERTAGSLAKSIVCWIAVTAVAFVLYLGVSAAVQYAFAVEPNASHLEYSDDIVKAAMQALYWVFLSGTFDPNGALDIVHTVCLCALVLLAAFSLVRVAKARRIASWRVVSVLLLALLMPLVSVLPCIIFDEYNYRMSFGMFLFVPVMMAIVAAADSAESVGGPALGLQLGLFSFSMKPLAAVCALLVVAVLGANVAYANGAYTYQKVLYDRSVVQTARIVGDMDDVEGYVAGKTPVVFIGDNPGELSSFGSLADDRFALNLPGYWRSAITYKNTLVHVIQNLGVKMEYESDDAVAKELAQTDEVKSMPLYPEDGYVQMVDGILVVKFDKQ